MSDVEIELKTEMTSWLKMVEQLCHAADWPEDELPVEMKQTHISVLLLGRKHVVKLKKPVDFGFLDYTTLKKRLKACEDEVRLNRRLCPETYIGVGEVKEIDGQFRFSGWNGKLIDYCVWMHRLPDDRMLDRMVIDGTVTEAIIDRVADRLSEFHAGAARGPEIAKWGSPDEIRHNWEENFEQTAAFVGRTISETDYEAIRAWVNRWLNEKGELFERRVRQGRIVDGHGDVRCESICVKDDVICLYDCIEFNDRFRCSDLASEAAFLAMDLDARGQPDLGYYFTERYQQRSGDDDLITLLPFYRCYRAYVRGKVLSFRLNEPEFSEAERQSAATRANGYFDLARRYAARLQNPTVIIVGGLSGTGKTSVARAIAGEMGLRVISTDAVRQSLFGDAKRPSGYGEGAYTAEANRLTYQKMFEHGRKLLIEENGVILDATFRRAEDLAKAREMSESAGAQFRLIECRLSPEQVMARLEQRAARGEGYSDATWEIYLKQREEAQSLLTGEPGFHLILDTGGKLSMAAHTAADWLRDHDNNLGISM
ncbi:MAG: AAA family ATPase [Acidobacteria bacterium]|nr:AAA family ATPase [Acidobacteriota bacterium]